MKFIFIIYILFISLNLKAEEFNKIEYCIIDHVPNVYSNPIKNYKNKINIIPRSCKSITFSENEKINRSYSNKDLLFKIELNKLDKNYLYVDALSSGYISLLNSNYELVDSYGFEKNDNFFPIFKVEKGIYYIIRSGNLRFDGKLKLINNSTRIALNNANEICSLLFIGSLIYLFLYHFGYYLYTKNKSFLYYVLFNVSYSLIILTFSNFFYRYNESLFFEELLMSYVCFSAFFLGLLSKYFLNFNNLIENKYNNIIKYVNLTILLLGMINLFNIGKYRMYLSISIDIISILAILHIYYHAFKIRKKNKIAYYYLIAWFFSYTGVLILYSYEYFNLFYQYSHIIKYSVMIGCFLEMIINSFGLAYQHKQILLEKTKATLEAIDKKRYQIAVKMLIHDISNPLTLSIMSTDAIKTKAANLQDAMLKKMIVNITKANDKIKMIIDDTKSYEQNFEKFSNEESSTSFDVYKDLSELFSDKLTEKNIKLIYRGDTKIQLPIKSSILVNNILANFLSNSIKFSNENGTILLIINQTSSKINISIVDYGCGMTLEQLEKLRNKISTTSLGTKSEKGTGFGMQIATTLIHDLNGELEITSSQEGENKGTTYKVMFNRV